ncbi:M23 family metallopeptidase [Balneolaceae bacterium ANBcel3]|nr:M23 family metallopeptidase [Balneolaceae bacterium ANBcel3]
MIDFLSKLFKRRKENITVLLLDHENPHHQENYTLKPVSLFFYMFLFFMLMLILVFGILYLTPAGTYLFNKEDRAMRSQIIEVSERIRSLQDSLYVRDQQLYQIQRIIRNSDDTLFQVSPTPEWQQVFGQQDEEGTYAMTFRHPDLTSLQSLTENQILTSGIMNNGTSFPAEPPVRGSVTASYQPDYGHFGIDIAATIGSDVRTIADGIIISSDWTINNGYVIHILHEKGLVSVYKHFSKVFFRAGDVVRRNDIIGTVGETGLLASGPHIHFELWKDGIALDPAQYINLY